MTVLVRALGIGLAAVAANLLMSVGVDGDSGANIGAGLAILAVLAGGGFTWALLDGLGMRRGASTARYLNYLSNNGPPHPPHAGGRARGRA